MKSLIWSLEEKIHDLIDKHLFWVGIVIILVVTLLIRLHLMPITMLSGDYLNYLEPWVEYYQENGIIKGLSENVGNYYVPYNLFLAIIAFLPGEPWRYIAGFSILCDYVSAYFIYLIAKMILSENDCPFKRKRSVIVALVSLLLPAVLLNGALLKQCDSVYTCFIIISIYYAMKKRYSLSLIMLGISFIFKLQAIYLFPVFIMLYIFRENRLSLFHFLWIPIMYLIGGLPAIFSGRRILDVYDIYWHQINSEGYNAMTIHMPNLYNFGLEDYPALSLPAVLITLCIFIFMALTLQNYRSRLNGTTFLYLSIWCLWTCIMFLPAQHERYNFPVLILLTTFYLITDIRKCWVAIIINIISCVLYGNLLFGCLPLDETIWAIFHLASYIYMTYDLLKLIKIKNI